MPVYWQSADIQVYYPFAEQAAKEILKEIVSDAEKYESAYRLTALLVLNYLFALGNI